MNLDFHGVDGCERFLCDSENCTCSNCTKKRLANPLISREQTVPIQMTTANEREVSKDNYEIKLEEYGKENDVHVAEVRSNKKSILSRGIDLVPKRYRLTDDSKITRNHDMSPPYPTMEELRARLILEEAKPGTSAVQNADKTQYFNRYSKDTVIYNDVYRQSAEDEVSKVQVRDVNALTYELEYFSHNAMIMFNHEYFCDGVATRAGTDRDVTALIDTFKRFRFNVTTHNDLKRKQLLEVLQRFGKQNFEDCGCICVAILTHGSDHGYLRAADVRYSERDLFACFDTRSNPTLVAIPIIFLIQACRGDQLATAVRVPLQKQSGGPRAVELDADGQPSGYFLPTEADMIIFHSCFFGRASARVVDEGTWFIQTICEQLNLHASTEHLEEIFRRVRKVIALEKGFENAKQMPVMSTTLLRKLYLLPKRDLVAKNCVNPTNNDIATITTLDANLDSTKDKLYIVTKHALLGVALTIVYCSLLYSSVVRQHIFFFSALVFAYMGYFGVSWSKMLLTFVLLHILLDITGHSVTWEITKFLVYITN